MRTWAWLTRAIPSTFQVDPYGGFSARYQLRWGVSEAFAVALPVTPFWLFRSGQQQGEFRRLGSVGIGMQWRLGGWLVPALELNAHYLVSWQGRFAQAELERFPLELAVNLLAAKLRLSLTAGVESFGRPDARYLDRVVFNAGISDLPGFLYWLLLPLFE
jgi:hypothetical protein